VTINYHTLTNWKIPKVEHSYSIKDTMLYTLALGYGEDAAENPIFLKFVYESGLMSVPSMAAILGYPGFWMREPGTGIDWVKMLHGEQRIKIHERIPTQGTLVGLSRVKSITDKGESKGAIVVVERRIINPKNDSLIGTVEQISFLRGNGGYSQSGQPSDPFLPGPSFSVQPAQSKNVKIKVGKDMALIYRLCGDLNPIHADPFIAQKAGFEKPILHGLATYGLACRAIIHALQISDPFEIETLNVRFSAPVYPGETLLFEIHQTDKEIGFTATAEERKVIVMKDGYSKLR